MTSLSSKIKLIFFGLFSFVLALELALRLAGFSIQYNQELKNARSLKEKGSYRILCLGESTTALGGQDAYPSQLENVLNERSRSIKFSVINAGYSGVGTSYLLGKAGADIQRYRPDMVVVMMGVNDYGPHLPYTPESFSKPARFIRSLRIYKLARLLDLHLSDKLGLRRPEYDFAAREKFLVKRLEKNPDDLGSALALAEVYNYLSLYKKATVLLLKAIESNPRSKEAYWNLAWAYYHMGKNFQATQALNDLLALDPGNGDAYLLLARIKLWGFDLKEFDATEKRFRKVAELLPDSEWSVSGLAGINERVGNIEASRRYFRELEKIRLSQYNPVTKANYLRLKKMLDREKIKMVCVQYPMRSLEPLKRMLEGEEGCIFVDNETVFKDAVKGGKYCLYFSDNFGGDFGHCTAKGNRLLAENIAEAILKEVSPRITESPGP